MESQGRASERRQSLLRFVLTASVFALLSHGTLAIAQNTADQDTADQDRANDVYAPEVLGQPPEPETSLFSAPLRPAATIVVPENLQIPTARTPANAAMAAQSIAAKDSALQAYGRGDIPAALSAAKQAGAAGDAQAQLLAGHILGRGQMGPPDHNEAQIWYLKAATQGNADAMIALGDMGIKSLGTVSAKDGREWLVKAAGLGRTLAMLGLADIYTKGIGVPKDIDTGKAWLEKAADKGDVLAVRALGDMHLESDPNAALGFYERAAAQGDADSAYTAAILYAENVAIRPNEIRAIALMEQAATALHPAAMADYGLLVYQGRAGDSTPETAAKWFESAARAGDDQGKFLYAFTLAKGEGVPRDYEEAYFWLLQTDQSGIPIYDKDVENLKTKLEANVDPAVLAKARQRIESAAPY